MRFMRFILLLVLVGGVGWGQAPGSNKTQIVLQADPPAMAVSPSAQVNGTPGSRQFYYWVVAKFPVGNSFPAGPVAVFQAPDAMSGGNYVRVAWTGATGATSYDVLRTVTAFLPNVTSSILVGNTANLSLNNTSDTLTSYTLAQTPGASWFVALDNKNYPYAVSTFASDPITPTYIGIGIPTLNCVISQRYFQTDATTPGDNVWWCTATNTWNQPSGGGGGGAPSNATYVTNTPNASLSNEQALSLLATGLMQVSTATGLVTSVTTSAGVIALISDETGTGAMVFGTSPTLITPNIGVATATSVNGLTITSTTGTVTLTNGKTFSVTNTLTMGGTDGSTIAFGGGGTVAYINVANAWADGVKQTFNPDATNAGLNLGAQAGDPSSLANGDMWYNSTTNKYRCRENGATVDCISGGGGSGTVTSVGWTGGIVSVANPTTTPAFTIAGTSGGIPYFNSGTTWATSAALTANLPVLGGGAGSAPVVGGRSGTTTGYANFTGIVTGAARCAEWDTNGNLTQTAGACNTAGSGTVLTGSATIDFASVVDGACSATSNITVTGAATTDAVTMVQAPATTAGTWYTARITGANTVAVTVCNISGVSVDLASGSYIVGVVRP